MQLRIAAPASISLNLTSIIKPLLDGLISALHCYDGNKLDEVAARIATKLLEPAGEVRNLLKSDGVLGARSVPHLRGDGLQWSPADNLLTAAEIIREFASEEAPITVCGYVCPVRTA